MASQDQQIVVYDANKDLTRSVTNNHHHRPPPNVDWNRDIFILEEASLLDPNEYLDVLELLLLSLSGQSSSSNRTREISTTK